MDKFKSMQLSEGMLSAIAHAGFKEPSEIQEKTIPLVLADKDVIGSSATGSGKTLAFGAGIIDKMKKGIGVQTLVLTPTRELAEQVALTMKKFSHFKGLNVKEIYGGVGMGPQIRDLRYADIVVGTPGRILDHLNRRTLRLSGVKFLVLDEADRMLDMGFIRDVEKIINLCPKERQTLLFSATISREIDHIAKRHMINPVYISVENQVDPSKLYQTYYDVSQDMKFSLLVHLLKLEKDGVVMVFCNTRRNVDKVKGYLSDYGVRSLAIHGGLSQNRRSDNLEAFHKGKALVLICTDVAARGLDIKDVSHVYNFDLPTTSNDYIHRIGRTARAGKDGIAISFVSEGDHGEFRQICKEKSLEIEKLTLPVVQVLPVKIGAPSRGGRQGRGGGRGGGFRGGGRSGGRGRSSGNDRSEGHRGGRYGDRDGGRGGGFRGGRGGGRARSGGRERSSRRW